MYYKSYIINFTEVCKDYEQSIVFLTLIGLVIKDNKNYIICSTKSLRTTLFCH